MKVNGKGYPQPIVGKPVLAIPSKYAESVYGYYTPVPKGQKTVEDSKPMKLYPPESLHADAQSKQQIDIKNDIKPSIGNHSKQLIIWKHQARAFVAASTSAIHCLVRGKVMDCAAGDSNIGLDLRGCAPRDSGGQKGTNICSTVSGWWCSNHLEKWWSSSMGLGWHPIYEMENKIHVWNHIKPGARYVYLR